MTHYHTCPGPGCQESVPNDLLMCRQHWYRVPRELRGQVWRTYRLRQEMPDMPELIEAHQAACAAAVRALEA